MKCLHLWFGYLGSDLRSSWVLPEIQIHGELPIARRSQFACKDFGIKIHWSSLEQDQILWMVSKSCITLVEILYNNGMFITYPLVEDFASSHCMSNLFWPFLTIVWLNKFPRTTNDKRRYHKGPRTELPESSRCRRSAQTIKPIMGPLSHPGTISPVLLGYPQFLINSSTRSTSFTAGRYKQVRSAASEGTTQTCSLFHHGRRILWTWTSRRQFCGES